MRAGTGLVGGQFVIIMALVALVPLAAARYEWPFDVETLGDNATWNSSDSVPLDAGRYTIAYRIEQMWTTATWMGLEVDVDVTAELPADFRQDIRTLDGPPPCVAYDGRAEHPPPPASPGYAADITIGLSSDGHGQVSMANVLLDDMEVEAPWGGMMWVTLIRVQLLGRLMVYPGGLRLVTDADALWIVEDGSASASLRLSDVPPWDITVDVATVDGDDDLTLLSPTTLTFTPTNWNQPQTVKVEARRDADTQAGRATIRCSAAGLDAIELVALELEDCNANGIADTDEIAAGDVADCDADGVPDACAIASGTRADCNANGVPDRCDIASGASADCDVNGVPDECEPDTDQDGVINACDGCPLDPDKVFPQNCGCGQDETPDCQPVSTAVDSDGDGVPDTKDLCPEFDDLMDTDLDGVPDCLDNCPALANPDQRDVDADGVGDACAPAAPADEQAAQQTPADEDLEVNTDPLTLFVERVLLPACGGGGLAWAPLTAVGLGFVRWGRKFW